MPDSTSLQDPVAEALYAVAHRLDADIYLYSGSIDRVGVAHLLEVAGTERGRENCVLLLSTNGGDPNAAFILARFLKRRYEKFTLFVFGTCKSAGTLIALGADEVVISDRGELGPLDVQTVKEDTIGRQSSGLDIFQAVNIITSQAIEVFDAHFLHLIARSGGAITAKTAADIASSMAAQLLAPIAAQIDPIRLGEMQRAISIAQDYGARLGAKAATVTKLITDYPSHGFVIDLEEAKTLFPNVREPESDEVQFEGRLREQLMQSMGDCIRTPHATGIHARLPVPTVQTEIFDVQHDADSDADQETVGGIDGETDSQAIRESEDHSPAPSTGEPGLLERQNQPGNGKSKQNPRIKPLVIEE